MADIVTVQTIADTSGVKYVAKLTNFSDGTGEVTLFFENDNTKEVVLSGRGNYGLKPGEEKIKDVVGNILLDSDSNVTKYNLVIEAHKESGYN